ncbi:hypothetical protein D910_03869 [Dendroctonus ponderosae]|uniref:UDP-glycosyltransferases domain-containing protein n=1 Tax=Dendroctonus ponderosae TaxID=77166 RepID=U4U2D6_DENPD|nr:hypothetical protein D910_03869 [Dendroctonus ponderosae]
MKPMETAVYWIDLNILYNKLMKGMADAGHEVTVISAYKNKLPIGNGSYTDVILTGVEEEYEKILENANYLESAEQYPIWQSYHWHLLTLTILNQTFTHPNVLRFLKQRHEFDAVVTEYGWGEAQLALSSYYQCPLVVLISVGGVNSWVNDMLGNPVPISYVPHSWMLGDFSQGMNLLERLHNMLFFLYDQFLVRFIQFPANDRIIQSYMPNGPKAADLYHSPSLVLLGSHSSFRQSTPMAPNMVEIGGFHIDPPQPLPKDLQLFLDEAQDGAIFFSMGSHVKSKDFSAEKKQLIINVFGRLKQRVLWKFEDDALPEKPSNVMVRKWMPQIDILAHPNIKLFISHGGHGSILEALYHGVPTLMIPVFLDQFNNAFQSESRGFALKLSYRDRNFTEETFHGLIKEMLINPKYRLRAQELSRLFHDRPMKPMETAVYWIEYVIRNKGAEHLKLGSLKLRWFEYYMVDVLLVLVGIVASLVIVLVLAFKWAGAWFGRAGKIKQHLNILYNKLMKGMADAGHEVTVISAYKNKLPIENGSYTDVILTGFEEEYEKILENAKYLETAEQYPIWQSYHMHQLNLMIDNQTFSHPNVLRFLKERHEFDAVVTEYAWGEAQLALSSYYQCPLVVLISVGGVNSWVNDMLGNPVPISYVPHSWMLGDFSQGMNLLERLHNMLFFLYDQFLIRFIQFPANDRIIQSYMPNGPKAADLYHSPSLVLLGSHSSFRQSTPMAPNMVEIGGFHIDPPQPLPKDLQLFLDEAQDGAIFFSMGSHVKSKDFSAEKKQLIINVFGRLKQRVLWKFEDDALPEKPSNVMVRKWMPQIDILAHPNIKLFISHGGHGSILEALYHGVPTLMIPVFLDQFNNAFQSESRGFALKLSYRDRNFTEETFHGLIKEMLINPKYQLRAQELSRLFHDRPMKPMETAVYWIEYVIRNKGAEHFKLGSLKLGWFEYCMVDVLLVLVGIVASLVIVLVLAFKWAIAWFGRAGKIKQQ